MDNRPKGREKNVTGQGKTVGKRGDGLGSGPVGNSAAQNARKSSGSAGQSVGGSGRQADSTGTRNGSSSRKSPLMAIIAAVVVLLGGGGIGVSSLLGGSDSAAQTAYVQESQSTAPSQTTASTGTSASASSAVSSSAGSTSASSSSSLSGLFGSLLTGSGSSGTVSTGWTETPNTGSLDTSVAEGSRAKRTQIVGGGQDTVTIMVYMCGTDLESKYGMATSDLQEMMAAQIGDQVNLLVCTGGCKQWKNNVVSSSVNQIYKVESGGLRCLVSDFGTSAMTKPDNLTSFIEYCGSNYPADRYGLIFWDHGGGSLSGYGYDEKNSSSGSMTLSGINQALKNAGMTFDFIGFDACLMATLETGLMLTSYADYMIASEETEPGVGWYYTNWLTKLSANTSMSTLEIGKNIVDDFVDTCAVKCSGQKTTLSVTDLAELENTVPDAFKAFSTGTVELLKNDRYQAVSDARSSTREFASSSKIDQVDLIHLARNLDTEESNALAEVLLGAVKYNRTSKEITDAYGISIYFPYKKTSGVNSAVSTYNAIGLDSEYSRCIQQFAAMESCGQSVSGGTSSPYASLSGISGSSTQSLDSISSLLGALMGSASSNKSLDYLAESELDAEQTAAYLEAHQFDASQLVWSAGDDGVWEISLSEDQWSLVHDLELNVFLDDGEGWIDLGLDNVFELTEDGCLVGSWDGTWLALDQQPVAYYHTDTVYDGDNYTITGRSPCLLNGERADLILVFDNEDPYGRIVGARSVYDEEEVQTVAKGVTELCEGDVIEPICDYYSYDGTYADSYLLGDPIVWNGDPEISNVYVDEQAASASYLFTDLYCQYYWTPAIP